MYRPQKLQIPLYDYIINSIHTEITNRKQFIYEGEATFHHFFLPDLLIALVFSPFPASQAPWPQLSSSSPELLSYPEGITQEVGHSRLHCICLPANSSQALVTKNFSFYQWLQRGARNLS